MAVAQKHASWLVSAAIILLLVLAGPAQAFNLSLALDDTSPVQGKFITFTAQIEIENGERLPVEYLTLTLTGAENQICKFSPSGSIIENCKGITIEKIQSPSFGYGYNYGYLGYGYNFGYGYGYGYNYGYGNSQNKLVYKITLDTSQYSPGNYESEFSIKTNLKTFTKAGPQFRINAPQTSVRSHNDEDEAGDCETSWTCTDFGPCVNGYQYRSCTLINPQCSIYSARPQTARTCSFQNLNQENGNSNQNQAEQNQNSQSENSQGLSRITGAVVGSSSTFANLFVLIASFLIIIGGIWTALIIRKIRLKKSIRY